MPPFRVDVGERIEHEAALVNARVRQHGIATPDERARSDQIEIEDAVPPAAPGPPPETNLDALHEDQQRRRLDGDFRKDRGVDIGAAARPEWTGGANLRHGDHAQSSVGKRRNRGRDDLPGRSGSSAPVRSDGDDVCCGHAAARYSLRRMEANLAAPFGPEPPRDCPRCPRLVAYRLTNRAAHPDWWNAPVPGWGDPAAWLCVAGLAPGVSGANRTGRPFTGDGAGVLLYATLLKFGLAAGTYLARPDDGLRLSGVFISNAARCVPPGNRPTPEEVRNCRPFLEAQFGALPNLKVVIALGQIAHQSAVKALGGKLPKTPFGHGATHRLHGGVTVIDSYHCSRLNTNTGRLTPEMFEAVFAGALAEREAA